MQYKQSVDFNNLYCKIHPCQIITNFCNDEKCLIGLCATCVCLHTQMHAQSGTIAQYQNIRDTFNSLYQQTKNQINHIQDDKNKLGRLRQQIEVKKITIRQTIRQLKQDAVNKIKQDFDQLEKKIINDIVTQQKKQGFHSNPRFQALKKNLNSQTDTLYSYIDGLNSYAFLDWSKKLKRDLLIQSEIIRNKYEKQIQDNQTYTAHLKWNPNFLVQISTIVKKMFSLQFIIPKLNTITPITTSHNNSLQKSSMILSRASSIPKFSTLLPSSSNSFHKRNQTGNTVYSAFQSGNDPKIMNLRSSQYMKCDLSQSKIYGKQNQMKMKNSFITSTNIDSLNRSSIIANLNYTPKTGMEAFRQSKLRLI